MQTSREIPDMHGPRFIPWMAKGEPPLGIIRENHTKQDDEEQESFRQERLICRHCQQFITTPAERIEIHGSHRHTFSNPAGLLYQIGCFRRAKGCEPASRQEAEWSWFRGYTWQVVLCSTCFTHMGWRYDGGSDFFYGLILHRLMQES